LIEKIHRNALKPGYKLHWYEIKDILGQGGFGITYLAHDKNLDKDVAIKEYLPIELAVREGDFSVHPLTEDRGKQYQWGLDRFVSEARTLSRFDHPNIVRVHAVFEENNTGYMVMAYEEGSSMQQLLAGKQTMEEAALIKILVPILGGLELIHQTGFIHRDIKPDNIFIRKDGSPVLLDFGSARQALGEQTKTLTSLVSPGYAPFEQYYSKSDAQGPWTDIYGMGATLYRAIAGIAPLDAVDRSKSILEDDEDHFVSALEIGKGKYSERFLKAIDHALMFKNQERPQSIAAWKAEFGIQEDLDEIKRLQNMEQAVTQPGTKVIQKPPTRLRPISITLLLLIVIVGAAFYYQESLKQLLAPALPETIKPELTKETPTPEALAQAAQQAEEEAARRKHGETIKQLMTKAEHAYNNGQYLEPVANNALDYYLKVLDTDPSNASATAGKQKIFDHFINTAQTLIDEQRFDTAERALLKADIVEPDSRAVKLARLLLDEKRTEAERIAMEEEQRRLEEERKQQEKEKAKQLAELAIQKQEEERKQLAEQKRLEDEKKRKEEEARQLAIEEENRKAKNAEIERQQMLAESKKQEEQQAIQQCENKKQEIFSEPNRFRNQTFYSALAIGENNGWGESWGYATREDAEQRALKECINNDSGCELKTWTTNCIAFATSNEGATGWGWSDTVNNARKIAIENCEQYAKCCNIKSAYCADQQ
jgi:serine/threonine protein kinase